MSCLRRAACAKAWRKEEHQGLKDLRGWGAAMQGEGENQPLEHAGARVLRGQARTGCCWFVNA